MARSRGRGCTPEPPPNKKIEANSFSGDYFLEVRSASLDVWESHCPTRAHPETSGALLGPPKRPPKGTSPHILGTALTRPQIGAAFEGRYPIMLVDPPFEILSSGDAHCKKLTHMRPGWNQFSNTLSGNV